MQALNGGDGRIVEEERGEAGVMQCTGRGGVIEEEE